MLLTKAYDFAKKKHEGQKYSDKLDFFETHLKGVYDIITLVAPGDINLRCAALLHDSLEDTKTTYEDLVSEFNKDIADLVIEVTNNKRKEFPNLRTQRGIILKFADRLFNLTRMENWSEERKQKYIIKSIFWK